MMGSRRRGDNGHSARRRKGDFVLSFSSLNLLISEVLVDLR